MSIYESNETDFYDDMEGVEYVLVDFFKDDCPPCEALYEELEKLEEHTDFSIMKVNYEENDDLVMEARVKTPPTLVLYKNGKKFRSLYGKGATAESIEEWFNNVTGKEK